MQLSKHNPARIYLAARSEQKAHDAIADIKRTVPHANITFLSLDLTSFASIEAAAAIVNAAGRLDLLLNNAGIMACGAGVTKEGYEMQLGTNHIGHALLTKLVMPSLQRAAKMPGADVRIVNVSSEGHKWAPEGGLVLQEAKSDMQSTSRFTRYGQSKLANILFTKGLTKHFPEIRSVCVHPGTVQTNLASGMTASYPILSPLVWCVAPFFTVTVAIGAWSQLWACMSGDAHAGLFYSPVGKETAPIAYGQDMKLVDELWKWTENEFANHAY